MSLYMRWLSFTYIFGESVEMSSGTELRRITTAGKAGLKGFVFHYLCHQATTELAESGMSERTIMVLAGHVSRRMLECYSHIRMEAKRAALEAVSPVKVRRVIWHKRQHKNR
jgi:integrase